MKQALFIFAWISVVVIILRATPAPGTDSSRFSDELTALYGEIFNWHESMYIFPGDWEPDLVWKDAISAKVEAFQKEMARLPKSACADEARAIVQRQGAFVAYTEELMPAIERAWKETLNALPLTCGEF